MDYGRRELADRLAAEYVLGTLRGPARRRFERLLPAHPALRAAVAQWQQRLQPLDHATRPVQPPEAVWRRIESALFPAAAPAAEVPWWQRLGVWRAASGLAVAAAAALVVVGQQPQAPQAPLVVVLAANPALAQAAAGAPQARFVASLSPDGRALVLRPIDSPPLTAQQALELWAVPAAGAPRSLGLVRADAATTLLRSQPLLGGAAALAVSVEPAGGSPTGAPTGPIVSLAKLQS